MFTVLRGTTFIFKKGFDSYFHQEIISLFKNAAYRYFFVTWKFTVSRNVDTLRNRDYIFFGCSMRDEFWFLLVSCRAERDEIISVPQGIRRSSAKWILNRESGMNAADIQKDTRFTPKTKAKRLFSFLEDQNKLRGLLNWCWIKYIFFNLKWPKN